MNPEEQILERVREKQSRHLVVWKHKPLGEVAGMKEQSISCLAAGIHPVTAERLAQFTLIQNNYKMMGALSEIVGGIFLPPRQKPGSIKAIECSEIIKDFGDFLSLFEKVKRGEKLTDSEMRILEIKKRSIGDILDVTTEQARQDRLPKSNPDDN